MAKAKKVEKRSAPKKAVKQTKKFVSKEKSKLVRTETWPYVKKEEPTASPAKPRKNAYIEKTGKPRYPQRPPEKPPEPEQPKIEITVRNVYYDGQFLPALCFRKPGALHVPCIAGDPVNGVRKFTIAAPQHDKSTILEHGYGNFAAPYSPERFALHMKRIGAAAPVQPEARTMLLPYCSDMPYGPQPELYPNLEQPEPDTPAEAPRRLNGSRKAPSGPARTSGKELIRSLAAAAKLPPEKVRAKLRAAGMRAPYTDESACRKALGVSK